MACLISAYLVLSHHTTSHLFTPTILCSALLVYDVARKETFDSLSMWLQEVEQFSMGGGKEVVKLLVGNKVDQERVVQRNEADEWARAR